MPSFDIPANASFGDNTPSNSKTTTPPHKIISGGRRLNIKATRQAEMTPKTIHASTLNIIKLHVPVEGLEAINKISETGHWQVVNTRRCRTATTGGKLPTKLIGAALII